jgi:hypothetical protein
MRIMPRGRGWVKLKAAGDWRFRFGLELDEAKIVPFDWIEDGKGYREFLVPAAIVNTGRDRAPDAPDGLDLHAGRQDYSGEPLRCGATPPYD